MNKKFLSLVLVAFLSTGLFAQELRDYHVTEIMENFHDEEAGLAKIGKKQAQHKEVREFAKKLYDNHKRLEKDVEKVAKKNKIDMVESELSKTRENELKAMKAALKMAPKPDFDKTFITQQIDINNMLLQDLDSLYIPAIVNPDFKNHLNIMRENIVKNINEAKAIQTRL